MASRAIVHKRLDLFIFAFRTLTPAITELLLVQEPVNSPASDPFRLNVVLVTRIRRKSWKKRSRQKDCGGAGGLLCLARGARAFGRGAGCLLQLQQERILLSCHTSSRTVARRRLADCHVEEAEKERKPRRHQNRQAALLFLLRHHHPRGIRQGGGSLRPRQVVVAKLAA